MDNRKTKRKDSEFGKRVTLWMTNDQLRTLDEIKKIRGAIPVSALVRELLDEHLEKLMVREQLLAEKE